VISAQAMDRIKEILDKDVIYSRTYGEGSEGRDNNTFMYY